ncbi:MAG: hypothetical protein HDR02_12815 [Lachnospiraceae bacterium]|nr:hypothetical protein [Lachnospiraceae bacterium]
MILRNSTYLEMAADARRNKKKIIVYGAGMIGQVIVPYLIREYMLYDAIDCFVDMDERKKGNTIDIDSFSYEIRTPDYLEHYHGRQILLIANSKFIPVVQYLDGIETLNDAEGYIIPMMQIHELDQMKSIRMERNQYPELIPRKIHYCWFGGNQIPEFLQNCIQSWREKCPGYEIIEWNEDNYDINRHEYTKQAYVQKKWGFISDMARLDILYDNGGIYLDTDVTLIRNLDTLLCQKGFIGTEKWGNINTGGGCGFVAGHPMLKKLIEYRNKVPFILNDGTLNVETNGVYETKPFLDEGFKPNNSLQTVGNVTVYPSYVNHPYDYMSCELHKKETTVSIHHFYGGWMDENDHQSRKRTQEQYQQIVNRINDGGKPD